MPIGSEPVVVLDCRNNLGETVLWDDRSQRLWWANIHQGEVWNWAPGSAIDPVVHKLDERVGAIALREGGQGLAVALESGFALFDPVSGSTGKIADVESDKPTTRLNDGRVDPAGRFVCGGMDEASPQRPLSAIYSLDADGAVKPLLRGIHCANSICWSPDGRTLYFTDMPTRRIDAFDYVAETGEISNRRVFVDLHDEPGLADGSVVDAEGYLWNAQWGGGKVARYAPSGKLDREIPLPVSNPTCLCFGGADLDTLFITSAWFGLDNASRDREPHAGNLFAFKPGVKGRLEHRYAA